MLLLSRCICTQDEYDRAKYFFENARKSRKNMAATLGEAGICFSDGRYTAALEHYCEVVRINPRCSPSVRVGLGLCCYKLGQVRAVLLLLLLRWCATHK